MAEKQPSSRSCCVCGWENGAGLRTQWVNDRGAREVRSSLVLAEHFHGYPGLAHGGIVAALLDEAMVRSLLLEGGFDDLMVTARMEVAFRRATPTAAPITIVGRLLRRSGSRATAEAEIRLADGTVTAEAEGLLTRPPPEVKAAWTAERPFWSVDE